MTDTRILIDQLASRAQPVRRLTSPLRRTLLWAGLAAAVIAVVIANVGLQPGFASSAPRALEWSGSVLTALLAAYAVFQISVPGRSPSWAWLPLPPTLLWLSGVGWGCLREFLQSGKAALAFQTASWECAQAITMISVPLGLILLLMVRHAGVVRPASTAMLAALSAAAMSAAGVSLFHAGEGALMVLVWHLGAVALLSLLCGLFGQRLFAWIGHASRR
jgi:hypothetical protein